MIFLNFFSFDDHVRIVAIQLITKAADKATQKVEEPKTTLKNKNRKVDRINVAIKVPTMIYNT
jgi:hypothetical protein